MDPETILKNGASPKSQMSRGNFLRKACFVLFTTLALSGAFTSCNKADDVMKTVENGYLEESLWTFTNSAGSKGTYKFISGSDGVYSFTNSYDGKTSTSNFTYVYAPKERVGAISFTNSNNKVAFSISEDYKTMTATSTNGESAICKRQ